MTVDDARLNELRRIAFGRTHSLDDEARAAAARHELEMASTIAAEPAEPAEPQLEALRAPEPAPHPYPEIAQGPRSRHAWLVPIAAALVVGLLLGVGGTLLTARGPVVPVAVPTNTFAAGSTGRPPSVVPLSADQPVTGSPGDVAAAMLWFDTVQVDEDEADEWIVGDSDIVDTSTRLVYSMGGSKVWIAQSASGQLCLISSSIDQGALMCATPAEFASTGIPLHVKGSLSVVWNGQRLLVSAAADLQRDVRP